MKKANPSPRTLAYWSQSAYVEINRWLTDEAFQEKVTRETLKNDENPPGPFTKFLYHFAYECQAGWGVMIDFNEQTQRIYLTDDYYKWMHKMRDQIIALHERNEVAPKGKNC